MRPISKKIIISFLILLGLFFYGGRAVLAITPVSVTDVKQTEIDENIQKQLEKTDASERAADQEAAASRKANLTVTKTGFAETVTNTLNQITQTIKNGAMDAWRYVTENAWKSAASAAANKAVYIAMQKIAQDTGKWIGSGGRGQQPPFVKEGWSTYLTNIADEAAGDFISSVVNGTTKTGQGVNSMGVCTPDLAVRLRVGLGLRNQVRPQSNCTFRKMVKNWNTYLKDKKFLNNLQNMFEPTSNDLGYSLTMSSNLLTYMTNKKTLATGELYTNQGWIDPTNAAGNKTDVPGASKRRLTQADTAMSQGLFPKTQDPFNDAISTFLNTLLLELFNNLIRSLADSSKNASSPYSGDYALSQMNALNSSDGSSSDSGGGGSGGGNESGLYSYESTSYGGTAAAEKYLRVLSEPKFNVKGDYQALAELSACPNPTKAGPTNCVIPDKFKQAVTEKVTVADAIAKGYLNPNGPFGFNADGLEPSYLEGYPYRSLIILRKFRIIPVGWELAAERMKGLAGQRADIGPKTLQDLVNCYAPDDQYGDNLNSQRDEWCRGLVDPNWVLKSSLNYCRRMGAGPEIMTEQTSGTDEKTSQVSITRNENYCADEQACIKEKADGSCEMYGYCTEERRKWNFGANSCDALYNTCQTFRGGSGQTASYLQNSLNYDYCNRDVAGCNIYAVSGDVDQSTLASSSAKVNWNQSKTPMYFDRDSQTCNSTAEGCHEFVRTKPKLGTNLLINSDFEGDISQGGWNAYGTATSTAYQGNNALQISTSMTRTVAAGPAEYNVAGNYYTLSFYAKNCNDGATSTIGDADPITLQPSDNWVRYQVSYPYGRDRTENTVSFYIGRCIIDAIKLENGQAATDYSDYRGANVVYEKLMPAYMESSCRGVNAGSAACSKFVQRCSKDQEGCDKYTRVYDNLSVPAKVTAQDYCPDECLGYDTYMQSASVFDSPRDAYFIPHTAQACAAPQSGCDGFTNLDKVGAGAEEQEFYTYLRQCIKPATSTPANGTCGDFYTWEGSNEAGFQLKVFNLQVDENDGTDSTNQDGLYSADPQVTEADQDKCNQTIYNLPATNPAYNPDCRQFYNKQGLISYHLYKRTITCSDNCHPYRRTEKNIDPAATTATQCVGSDRHWDGAANECYYCKSRGIWDDQHQACIYQAIPGEGETCTAKDAGCREYRGNTGANMNLVVNNDFNGSKQGWTGSGNTAVDLSAESLTVGGNSLLVNGGTHTASTSLSYAVNQGKAYTLSFLAKSKTGANANISNIRMINSLNEIAVFGTAALTNEWKLFTFSLNTLSHKPDSDERLEITGTGDFYFDQLRLTEISDVYYLIKNSWNTPATCDRDLEGKPYPLFMLGCYQYTDRDTTVHNLHSFTNLCAESSIGCEMMIDTQNSTKVEAENFGAGADTFTVASDTYAYVVYDPGKLCQQEEKGCQRFGARQYYYNDNNTEKVLYKDAYIKSDPDQYANSMCSRPAVGCEEWSQGSTYNYFKNPGDMTCEYRTIQIAATSTTSTSTAVEGWYQKRIKRCDTDNNGVGEGDPCTADSDCPGLAPSCREETGDKPCPTSAYLTLGRNENGDKVSQPYYNANRTQLWTGTCPAVQSGCTEYIDPISKFDVNAIFNYSFSKLDSSSDNFNISQSRDGWQINITDSTSNPKGWKQNIKNIQPHQLYRLAGKLNSDSGESSVQLTFSCDSPIYQLQGTDTRTNGNTSNTNNLNLQTSSSNSITVNIQRNSWASKQFYSDNNGQNSNCRVVYHQDQITRPSAIVEIKEVVTDYQYKDKVDKTSCNGVVNFDKGCVLFNERQKNGSSWAALNYNADATRDNGIGMAPVTCSGALGASESDCDSNSIIKVSPDRACDKWLACRTFVQDKDGSNVCYNVGQCDSMSENGYCNNFLIQKSEDQTYSMGSSSLISNYTGYNKIGYDGGTMKSNLYPLGVMKQKGGVADLSNGSFEISGDNGYPLGWEKANWMNKDWINYFRVIDNPVSTQKEGIKRNPDGKKFLRIGPGFQVESEAIDVNEHTDYIISAYINTKNLITGNVYIGIIPGTDAINSDNFSIDSNKFATVPAGQDWSPVMKKINTGDLTNIKVILATSANSTRTAYFDGIKIRPALQIKSTDYSAQTCRLYPEGNALACDYFDDAGKREKGWQGYCLEHDRYPGNPDACLLWWPIDKVEGEGIEEGAGYSGKMPAYYCTFASAWCDKNKDNNQGFGWYCSDLVQTVSNAGQNKYWAGRTFENSKYEIPFAKTGDGKFMKWEEFDEKRFFHRDYCPNCGPDEGWVAGMYSDDERAGTEGSEGTAGSRYEIVNGQRVENFDCHKDCDSTGILWDCPGMPLCDDIDCAHPPASPICHNDNGVHHEIEEGTPGTPGTPAKEQKYNERIKTYPPTVNQVVLNYSADHPPFGSIYPPDPATNPVEWDGSASKKDGVKQPLFVARTTEQRGDKARAGTPYFGSGGNCDYQYQDPEINGGAAGTEGTGPEFETKKVVSSSGGSDAFCRCSQGDSDNAACCCSGTGYHACTHYKMRCPSGWSFVQCVSVNNRNDYSLVQDSSGANVGCWHSDNNDAVELTCQRESNGGTPGTPGKADHKTEYWRVRTLTYNVASSPAEATRGVKTIYAEGYKSWVWDGTFENGSYRPARSNNWTPPTDICACKSGSSGINCERERPGYPNDLCSIYPRVFNIKIDNSQGDNSHTVKLQKRSQFVNLTFNSFVDPQQLPLTMYAVKWGDEEITTISGVEMSARPDPGIVHSLYHLYSYWDMRSKFFAGNSDPNRNISCGTDDDLGNWCEAVPKVMIKDNWGWCSWNDSSDTGDIHINKCDSPNNWISFTGRIRVFENGDQSAQ